jgi:glutamate 5-kinase
MGRSDKKRILLKIGSNTLTRETDQISRGKIEDIGRQIFELRDKYEFIIVSSGAIAVARQFVNLESMGKNIKEKQALAAIGQPHLMRIFQENFRELGLFTSQCLLSYNDFKRKSSKENIFNTINILVENNYIPIINENDTVATDEIQFGDNDKLAALTATLLQVDLVIFASNTNGIYTKDSIASNKKETIKNVEDVAKLNKEVSDIKSSQGSGGMQSKINAAELLQQNNIETWLVNGLEDNFILNAMADKVEFTRIINSPLDSDSYREA